MRRPRKRGREDDAKVPKRGDTLNRSPSSFEKSGRKACLCGTDKGLGGTPYFRGGQFVSDFRLKCGPADRIFLGLNNNNYVTSIKIESSACVRVPHTAGGQRQ